MAVIAVINRKGGSGKSTLATHIAGYLASRGEEVMLADVDRQQSSRLWLALRPQDRPAIQGSNFDARNFARPQTGAHVILDTPAAFQGLGLMRVALYADAILIPATPSLFDREAAAEGIRELRTLPRIAAGKCRLACVGLRIDVRTRNSVALEDWAATMDIPYLGAIRQLQAYQRCVEQGLTLFDFPRDKFEPYLQEWARTTAWLDEMLSQPQPETRELVKTVHRSVTRLIAPNAPSAERQAGDAEASRPVAVPQSEGIPGFLRRLIPQLHK